MSSHAPVAAASPETLYAMAKMTAMMAVMSLIVLHLHVEPMNSSAAPLLLSASP